jgi:hypothetical protein
MAELLKVNVTRKELDEGIIPQNMVLCETYYHTEGAKTKGGIIYGINTDLLYNESDNVDDKSAHNADMQEVSFRVVKLPTRLYFNPDDKDKSMQWETEQELYEEDIVWCNLIESANAITLMCEGKEYRLLPYQDLICAKREIWVDKWSLPQKKKTIVIMLNGYLLCEQIMKESLSTLDVISQDNVDITKGRVAYFGSLNKSYIREDLTDFVDLEKGDVVLFERRTIPYLLERQKYASQFDSEKLYWVVQRSRIIAVIERA